MSRDSALRRRRALLDAALFLITLGALSLPFYLMAAPKRLSATLAPGQALVLMALLPGAVASWRVWREQDAHALKAFVLSGLGSPGAMIALWILALIAPAALWGAATWIGVEGAPGGGANLAWRLMVWTLVSAVLLILAWTEELGWSGYLPLRLAPTVGSTGGGVLIGGLWALWHVAHYVKLGHDLEWIVWQCVFTVLFRVLLTWARQASGGGLAAPTGLHWFSNLTIIALLEFNQSYAPRQAALGMAALLLGLRLSGFRRAGACSPRVGCS